MAKPDADAYRSRFVARGYDALNAALWFPTGSDRLRRELVAALDVGPGCRVLEIGCGTGLVTRHLCAAGAVVTAVDNAPTMLARAYTRAPGATFITEDALEADAHLDGTFDRVVMSFLLHEFDADGRVAVLTNAAHRLAPGGRIGILEWSLPPARPAARAWRAVIGVIEAPVALEVLDGGLERALAEAGLRVDAERAVAGGRARIVLASLPSGQTGA